EELHPFEGHPFKVLDNEEMDKTVESVRTLGIVTPLIARPDPEGGYEIISGHRRHHAAELAGQKTVPVIVREMDDDSAIILMVDANLQRENILPSERAFAYKMKMEAVKHQGERSDLTCRQVVDKLKAAGIVGEKSGESGRQVQRYIRLTELIPQLLDLVEHKQLAFNPAVEVSYLKKEEQATTSLSQAKSKKKLSKFGESTLDAMCDIMDEVKKGDLDRITNRNDVLKKYFPKSYTPKQMEDTIIRLLEQWQKKRQRSQER